MKYVAIDIETDDLDFTKGNVKLISGYSEGNYSCVYEDFSKIKDILEDKNIIKIFHNASFDVSWLTYNGIKVTNYVDTMIMAQILNYEEASLKYLCKKLLNVDLDKNLQSSDNWKDEVLTESHKQYCLNDSKYTYELFYILYAEIVSKGLLEVFNREMEVLPAMVNLKINGIMLDLKGWKEEVKVLEGKANEIEKEFKTLIGDESVNLNSPKQIIQAFQNKNIPIKSTADEVLAQFEDIYDEIKLLRKYRKLQKNIATFGYKITEYSDENNIIRPNWRQIGAISGRMSCSRPALQGVPRIMKPYFKAREGFTFVVADFSQVELRILAEVSRDKTMIDVFSNDMDLHSITASKVFNKSVENITDIERQIGKSLNFGIVYGITENGIQNQIRKNTGEEISIQEAMKYRLNFFKAYKNIYILQNILLKSKEIRSLGGRVWGNNLKSNQKLNYCIQGTGADVLKESLIEFMKVKSENYKLCAVVHDEIVIEVPKEESNKASKLLLESMEKGMGKFIKSVPCKVDIKISEKWVK